MISRKGRPEERREGSPGPTPRYGRFSSDQQTVTTATFTTCRSASLVVLNKTKHRLRDNLWLRLQWLQSANII